MSCIAEAHDAQEQVWFWCEADLHRVDPSAFRWNEIETMCIDEALDDDERRAIVAFWDRHFPVMMATHSDYDYLAVTLDGPDAGTIVHGYAPEWEPTPVAACVDEWLAMLTAALRAPAGSDDALVLHVFAGVR